jgi:transcription elongation factor GreA
VTVLNKRSGKEMKYTMVSAQEADFNLNRISIDSPIGAALLGKSIGDVVSVKAPAGIIEFEIKHIER